MYLPTPTLPALTVPERRAAADAVLAARDEVAQLPTAPSGWVAIDDVLGVLRQHVDAHTPPYAGA